MSERLAKDDLFDGFALVAKALGNGRRAQLIDVLAQGERLLCYGFRSRGLSLFTTPDTGRRALADGRT